MGAAPRRWALAGGSAFGLGPVPAAMLEVVVDALGGRWNEELSHRGDRAERGSPVAWPMQDLQVDWGDGSGRSWCHGPIGRLMVEAAPTSTPERVDLLVTVTMGLYVASLQVALLGLPACRRAV